MTSGATSSSYECVNTHDMELRTHIAPRVLDTCRTVARRAAGASWLLWLVLAAALAAGLFALDHSPVGVFYDDAMYVVLGKSIASGHGYRYLNLPGAPVATHYPPGYPLLLAVLWRVAPAFPANVLLFKIANVAFGALTALGTYAFAHRVMRLPRGVAAAGAIVGTVSLPALYLGSMVLSEPMFVALLMPLLSIAERGMETPRSTRRAVVLGAALGALALVRSIGILAVPSVCLVMIRRRRLREALCLAIASAIVLAPWFWWVHHFDAALPAVLRGAYGSYSRWLVDAIRDGGPAFVRQTIVLNASMIYGIVARTFAARPNTIFDLVTVVTLVTLAAVGAAAARRRIPVTLIFLALYFGLVLVWPFPPVRFVANLWPLLVLFPLGGAWTLWRGDAGAPLAVWSRRGVLAAAAAVAISLVIVTGEGYRDRAWSGLARFQTARIAPKLAWAARRTRASDVVATEDEVAVYLYTRREAVPVSTFTGRQHVVPQTVAQRARALAEIASLYRPSFIVVGTQEDLDAVTALAARTHAEYVRSLAIPGSEIFVNVRRPDQQP